MDFVQSASGGNVLAVGGLFAYLLILLWARQPRQNHRWFIVITATGMGLIIFIANQIARTLGWWKWWGCELPLVIQAGLLLILPSIFFVFILIGYRWLVTHSQHPLLWYGLIGVSILVPLTVLADRYSIKQGKLAFGGGYALWQDVLVGQAFFWLPILLYRFVRRSYPQTSV